MLQKNLVVALACLTVVASCHDSKTDVLPADHDATPFAVDTYPSRVHEWPVPVTGTKPAGAGVMVDGRQRLAPSADVVWGLPLYLDRGDQTYAFALQPAGADGQLGPALTVTITLDSVAPSVLVQIPTAETSGVALNSNIEAILSEPIDCASVVNGGFILSAGMTPVTATVTCVNLADAASLRLQPDAPLAASTRHRANLLPDVTDVAGNPLAAPVSWLFTTGTAVDTTPPSTPTFDAPAPPAAPTTLARVVVGGGKEAFASIEVERETAAGVVEPWHEVLAKTGDLTWRHRFELAEGANTIRLKSVDQANNHSEVASFVVTRDPSSGSVGAPTLDPVVSPTTAPTQVLSGKKPADTSIWNGATELVPEDGDDSWTALVTLAPGANVFTVTARDGADHTSSAAPAQTVIYDDSWGRLQGGSLTITYTLRDLWDYIGDEFNVTMTANDIDHFAVDIWAEGPLTTTGTGAARHEETCVFDARTKMRKHTRYAATLKRTVYQNCLDQFSPSACYGIWGEPDYRNPNYMAALIEAGRYAAAPYPVSPAVNRRNDAGEMWFPGLSPSCDPHLWWSDGRGCVHRLMQPPAIDGTTGATINAHYPQNGLALGAWSGTDTVHWDLKDDASGDYLLKGAYLVTVVVTVDRANAKARAGDRETCWNLPAHDAVGARRAEGVLFLDGATAADLLWPEKGLPETVLPCTEPDHQLDNAITCSCADGAPFPCPAPNRKIGEPVQFFVAPVHVVYTP
ncbi:MAG: Ig-like domain-containing protein [Deltaproteobacteria bacterium]|nr:Ig-like domain-containing protein [Deltaproteobacteria bacterium]